MTQPPDPFPAQAAGPDMQELPPASDSGGSEQVYGRPRMEPSAGTLPGAAVPSPVTPPQVKVYPMTFTGNAAEYFRIWIVNLALSVVTLGLYLPWAQIRTKQYFYGNTWVDGHNFEYTANPWALLRGYLIVSFLFGLYQAALKIQFEGWEWVAGLLVLLYLCLFGWIVRQTLRFRSRNTVHRGLSFSFQGTIGGAYLSYGLGIVVGIISGGLGVPWAMYLQRRYQIENLKYGQARGHFRGDVGQFYLIALSTIGIAIGGALVLGLLGAGIFALFSTGLESSGTKEDFPPQLVAGLVAGYGGLLLLYGVAWRYSHAAIMKYVLNNVELGGVVRLSATFSPWMVVWIGVSNFVAQVFTLGLLSPWAAVRRNRYVLSNIRVRTITNLNDFTAEVLPQENALGEAAIDLLGFDIGF